MNRKHRLRIERLETRLAPAIATWDGGGADNHWTTAANWAGDVAPNPGDDLSFPFGAAQPITVNDFAAGTAFNSISTNATNYQFSGNAIALAAGFNIQGSLVNLLPVALPITLTADQAFTGFAYDLSGAVNLNGHALTVNASGSLRISGVISGAGSVTFAGGFVETTALNTYTGPTSVINGGQLGVEGAIPGPITVSTNTAQFGASSLVGVGTVGNVTINDHNNIGVGPLFSAPRPIGTFTTGNLTILGANSTATFFTEMGGASDRLNVHGTVNLSGMLSVSPRPGDVIHQGEQFTLIANDGTDPIVGTFANAPEGGTVSHGTGAFRITYHGGDGNDVVATAVTFPAFAVAAGAGGIPQVNVYDVFGALVRSFTAYDPSFHGGVRVAVADIVGDSAMDIITVPGPGGGPVVRIWDGATGALTREFNAYDPAFRGGVFLAIANVNADSHRDIITGAGPGGGPHVKVFDGGTLATMESFMAYDIHFTGGVSVAGIDGFIGLHTGLIPGLVITGAGPGGGPHVKAFRTTNPSGFGLFEQASFFAYDASFRGGVNVAAHGVTSDFFNVSGVNVTTAPASAGGPDVRIYSLTGQQLGGFLAYDPNFFGGVTLAQHPLFFLNPDVIITGAGPGGGPHVKIWALNNNAVTLQNSFLAFDPAFTGGIYVG
jgi:hypothetical protein